MSDDIHAQRLLRLYDELAERAGPPPPFGLATPRPSLRRSSRTRPVVAVAALLLVLATGVAVSQIPRRGNDRTPTATTVTMQSDAVTVVITDDAMTPTLLAGDTVQATPRPGRRPEVGALTVLFESSGAVRSALPPGASVQTFVRRIVGLSGDRIELRNGVVIRNGRSVPTPGLPGGVSSPEHRVPDNAMAVLPDDRTTLLSEGDWWAVPAGSGAVAWAFGPPTVRLATVHGPDGRAVVLGDPGGSPATIAAGSLAVPHRYVVTGQRSGFVQIEVPGQQPAEANGWHRAKRTWAAADTVTMEPVRQRITINLTTGQLHATFPDGTTLTAPIAIGKPQTPTPKGRYQLVQIRRRTDVDVFGPGELRTTARSDVLASYLGDTPYLIAIQGTNDPATVGTAATNGNIRIANTMWEQLAQLPMDTPVIIR